jgi:hypothetical protein
MKVPQSLGDLQRIHIGHDNSGFGSAWFLDKVVIEDEHTGKQYTFFGQRWLDKSQGDGKIECDLYEGRNAGHHKVEGDKGHETIQANVGVPPKPEHEHHVKSPSPPPQVKVKSPSPTPIKVKSPSPTLVKVRSPSPPAKVKVKSPSPTQLKVKSPSPIPHKDDHAGKYKVTVYTGDVDNAGTDANVHIVLYGDMGNSGQPYKLDNSKNNFERKRFVHLQIKTVHEYVNKFN